MTVMLGNIIDDKAGAGCRSAMKNMILSVANILAEVLVPLTPVILASDEAGRHLHYIRYH